MCIAYVIRTLPCVHRKTSLFRMICCKKKKNFFGIVNESRNLQQLCGKKKETEKGEARSAAQKGVVCKICASSPQFLLPNVETKVDRC